MSILEKDKMKFTHKELLQVPCIRCMSAVGQPCVAPGNRRTAILGFHNEREQLRVKIPMLEVEGLDGSDKALVMGYGFLILADACAANSVKLFGKELQSREIQQFFAAKAIDELKADGLIGVPKVKASIVNSSYTCNNSPTGCNTEAGRKEAIRLGGCELHPDNDDPLQ